MTFANHPLFYGWRIGTLAANSDFGLRGYLLKISTSELWGPSKQCLKNCQILSILQRDRFFAQKQALLITFKITGLRPL